LKLRLPLDVAHIAVSAGEDIAQVFPPEMLHQVVIVGKDILKVASLRGHQQGGRPVVATEQIAVALLQGKQAVLMIMRAELKEYQAVEAAAMNFVKSVAEGNSTYAKKLFIDEAVLFGYLDGELEHGSIQQFYHNVDTVPGGENFKVRVDVLAVEETLAVVRVLEEGWGGRIDFTDILLLMKMNGEWKCVAKAYNQNSNTIQKK